MDWLEALGQCRVSNTSCVLVMIVHVEGSAPRSVGTRMVVTADELFGTIGGGALELEGIEHARKLINSSSPVSLVATHEYNLSKALSQCCGGKVTLQFDCHLAVNDVLHVFGAGHVAQEVARLAERLPLMSVFHDTRPEWLEQINGVIGSSGLNLSSNNSHVSIQRIDKPVYQYVEALEHAAFYLVMTHSHELDMEVVEAVLSRGDARYCGLIASKSKAAKFRNRLQRKGFSDSELAKLSAPLGQQIATGNTPMEVAIAGISDVLNLRAHCAKTNI